jgi:hypothetical protein
MIGKLGSVRGLAVRMAADQFPPTRKAAQDRTYVNRMISGDRKLQSINMTVRASYVEKAFPGIVARMVQRGSKAMSGKLQAEAERIVAQANRGQGGQLRAAA